MFWKTFKIYPSNFLWVGVGGRMLDDSQSQESHTTKNRPVTWIFSCLPRHVTYKFKVFFVVFLWISKIYLDFQGSTTIYIKRKLYSLVFITSPRVFHHLGNSMANHKGNHSIWVDNQQLSVCICSSCFPSDPTSTLKYTYLVFTSHVEYKEAVFTLSSWLLSPFL